MNNIFFYIYNFFYKFFKVFKSIVFFFHSYSNEKIITNQIMKYLNWILTNIQTTWTTMKPGNMQKYRRNIKSINYWKFFILNNKLRKECWNQSTVLNIYTGNYLGILKVFFILFKFYLNLKKLKSVEKRNNL